MESLVGDEGATTNAAGTPTLYSDNPGNKYVIAEKRRILRVMANVIFFWHPLRKVILLYRIVELNDFA